jgi:hypothetical protein
MSMLTYTEMAGRKFQIFCTALSEAGRVQMTNMGELLNLTLFVAWLAGSHPSLTQQLTGDV